MAAVDLSLVSTRTAPPPVPSTAELISLAKSRDSSDRDRLLLAITRLCRAAPEAAEHASDALADIFLTLVAQAKRDIRRQLSDALADAEWAPVSLVNMLALDEIEIARPVIARSPLLRDRELLRVVLEATIEHQIEVARRPGIGAPVVDAIVDAAQPCALAALATNATADITEPTMARLVQASRRVAALRAPLTRHPRMNEALAKDLYTWVGEALRQAIAERFRVDTVALDEQIARAVAAAQAQPGGAATGRSPTVDPERDEMERRLVAKLDAAGQLRPGYLVRAAREGRVSLFENAAALMGGYTVGAVRKATRAPDPRALALLCASVGIDRAVFPTLLSEIRAANTGLPGNGTAQNLIAVFDQDPRSAARSFRMLMGEA